ncbi:GGDEF domain-containing protein [Candidatus Gracilibacteria bacterium]|nr:GGDEF domain-containing protein [Candidatus Gracilibacteria bacterium]
MTNKNKETAVAFKEQVEKCRKSIAVGVLNEQKEYNSLVDKILNCLSKREKEIAEQGIKISQHVNQDLQNKICRGFLEAKSTRELFENIQSMGDDVSEMEFYMGIQNEENISIGSMLATFISELKKSPKFFLEACSLDNIKALSLNRSMPVSGMQYYGGLSDSEKSGLSEEFYTDINNSFWSVVEKLYHEKCTSEAAIRNALTGMFNKSFHNEWGKKYLKMGQEKEIPVSTFMIDINSFKSINDRFGHLAGDLIIKVVGETLLGIFEKIPGINIDGEEYFSFPTHWGGDEFSALLVGVSKEQLQIIAEKIMAELNSYEFINEETGEVLPINLSISIGGSTYDPKEKNTLIINFSILMQLADRAMYKAKKESKETAKKNEETLKSSYIESYTSQESGRFMTEKIEKKFPHVGVRKKAQ